jgi:hypothetical protein
MLPHVVVTSGVNSNQLVVSIKHKESRLNHLPKSNSLHQDCLHIVSIDLHMTNFIWFRPFMVIDDKGGEIWTKIYEMFGQRYKGDERVQVWTWHGSRGALLRRINILGQEKHTCRGSKLMNFIDCNWYVHIHVLACICISFKFYMHYLCGAMLVIELEWCFDN